MPAPSRETSATQYVTLVQSTTMPDARMRPDVCRGRHAWFICGIRAGHDPGAGECGHRAGQGCRKDCGRPPLAPELAERIRQAMAVPGRPGIRVIAKQFGVSPMTVQNVAN